VGDRVLAFTSADGEAFYSDIYFFGHRKNGGIYDFVEIEVDHSDVIVMSRNHLIQVRESLDFEPRAEVKNPILVAAHMVRIGDLVFSVRSNSWHPVSRISMNRHVGLYNPHTIHGTIIVNDILVSCYTDVVSNQLAHSLLLVERLVYWTSMMMFGSYIDMIHVLHGRFDDSMPWIVSKLLDGVESLGIGLG